MIEDRIKLRPCARCGAKEFGKYRWETLANEKLEFQLSCPACSGLLMRFGWRVLPDHPIFSKALGLLEAGAKAYLEYKKPVGAERQLPTAMTLLAEAVRAIDPELIPTQKLGAHFKQRVEEAEAAEGAAV